ncbi:MAG: hypothetical protein PHC51_08310 [bacterium]|nr:hypothetical protein [bacterium]
MRKSRRTEVLGMVKVKEILRLHGMNLSQSQISRSVNVSRSTVQDYISRASMRGLLKEDFSNFSDDEVLELLDKKRGRTTSVPEPDYSHISRELTKRGVTLQLLWEEYIRDHRDGLSYSRFCHRYRDWRKATRLSYSPFESHQLLDINMVDLQFVRSE